jgi:ribosomal protein S18 acetylase RimI-like enzyme
VREAVSSDLSRLKEIISLSFPLFFRYFALQSVSDLSEPVLVNQEEGVIAGFAKLIEFQVGGGKYGCILWIAVHPSYRHRGIAFNLTNAGVEYLKLHGAQAVFASTQRRNRGALATLGKAGFKRIDFFDLWRLFGWRVFKFYRAIWFAPGEIALMC